MRVGPLVRARPLCVVGTLLLSIDTTRSVSSSSSINSVYYYTQMLFVKIVKKGRENRVENGVFCRVKILFISLILFISTIIALGSG